MTPTESIDPRFLAKPGKKQTAVHDPELKRLRAIAMLRERLHGASYGEIAEKFRVHENTVRNTLTYAKRAGIIVEESDRILQDMVPLAREAVLSALRASDDDVDQLSKANLGMKILEGTGLLGNKGKPSGANSDDDDLVRAMGELRQRAQLLEETTDGELLDRPQERLAIAGGRPDPAEAGEADDAQPANSEADAPTVGADLEPPSAPPPAADGRGDEQSLAVDPAEFG